jgi:hypothetical protein
MSHVAELLESIAPPCEGEGDWERVLRDAGVTRRPVQGAPGRRALRLAVVAAVLAVIAVAAAAWPTGGPGPSVLERALAATGNGQVLHFVYESDPPRTLVDLASGGRTDLRATHEVWFDPQAGLRETETFDGVVQFDVTLTPDEVSEHARELYSGLGAGYREALESGTARVVGEEVVDGTPVYWIRSGPNSHDVAVSRETFQPVYIRIEQEGRTALTRIVSYETLGAGSAPLGAPAEGHGPAEAMSYGDEIELAGAAAALGRAPVWAGAELGGLRLGPVREARFVSADDEVSGLSLAYGLPDEGAHVEIMEAAGAADGLTMLAGVRGYVPREGTALLAGPTALVSSHGLVVVVHAPDEETALTVARALRPYPG